MTEPKVYRYIYLISLGSVLSCLYLASTARYVRDYVNNVIINAKHMKESQALVFCIWFDKKRSTKTR